MEEIEQLYHLYSKPLLKYLIYISGDNHLAEELLQETFYQAIKSIYRFKGNSTVSTWLYQIAKNVYYKHLYRVKKEHLSSFDEKQDLSKPLEEIFEAKEATIDLNKAILKLKDPYKEIVFLRSFSELSFKEIGAVFDQSEGWARTSFYRAKLQLKDFLSNKIEEAYK